MANKASQKDNIPFHWATAAGRRCASPVAHPKFSVTALADGVGDHANVRITKTTDLNLRKGQEFHTLMQELRQVRTSLGA